MRKKFSLIIFTDLDGSLLHRETFKFDPIKDYIKNLVESGIIIIPNSSKTEKEIDKFNEELGINCLLYTSPSPRDTVTSRMPSSA